MTIRKQVSCKRMTSTRISESDLARDIHSVIESVRRGAEVVIERNHLPVAVIRPPTRSGRPISECIASARASASKVTLDQGFAKDVEEGIHNRQQPWNPPSWD
jgi:antitoxin (DNA-binding transcriptional repressor) of toxin-antitoxin stability system